MEMEIPPYEIDELVRKHSKTYREGVLQFLVSHIRVGERLTLNQMTDLLVGSGYLVSNIAWWTQSRLLLKSSKHFKKLENATWQRVR